MPIVQIDTDTLKAIVRESVAEAIRADRYKFFEGMIPAVSEAEMKDIIDNYGSKPKDFDYLDVSHWFADEN